MLPGSNLPTEFFTEIGRVNVEWAVLESMMDLCLIKLIGKDLSDSRSIIIFNHMAFPMKLDIMGALCSELLPRYPSLAEYQRVLQSVRAAQEKRNAIVHAKWGFNEATKQVEISRLMARGKLKIIMAPIALEEIRAAVQQILESAQLLFELVTKAGTTNNPPQSGQ
jgi:hypothetical protein